MAPAARAAPAKGETKQTNARKDDVRLLNLVAAKGIADAVRSSLGPKGMDKMITSSSGEVIITNDGATIVDKMEVLHPAAKLLVEASKSQDIEAGDGTTSVVVICGALLDKSQDLIQKGVHPTRVADAFSQAQRICAETLKKAVDEYKMGEKVSIKDTAKLEQAVKTCLNSKVVSQHSDLLAPMAVKAVQMIHDPEQPDNVDLRNVRVVGQLGGTVEDTELVDGIVFRQHVQHSEITSVNNAKIGMIQFCLSAPKTNMEQSVSVNTAAAIDRIAREERKYIIKMVKKIKASGCNVLLIQKSILRTGLSVLGAHFLKKAKIMVINEIERTEVEFICKTIGCKPIADIENFSKEKLGTAKLAEDVSLSSGRIVKITGLQPQAKKTVSLLVRGSNKLILGEAERSIHDALCVVRCFTKMPIMLPGGGAPETMLTIALKNQNVPGIEGFCIRAFADALRIIPYTLAENSGLKPIAMVSELERRHRAGEANAGINVKKACVSDMMQERVVQPALVTLSAVNLAVETVRTLLKIDDIIPSR